MISPNPTLFERAFLFVETEILTRLVGTRAPGAVFRWVFKAPLILDRLGWHWMIPKNILILTTTGRKSGKTRKTPLEFIYDAATDSYWLMAGWAGRTDWYRNLRARPDVQLTVRGRTFVACAEPMPEEQVAQWLIKMVGMWPSMARVFSLWAAQPVDGSEESLRAAAPFFPCVVVREKRGI